MYRKLMRGACLAIAMIFIIASLGACKKSNDPAANNTSKTGSSTSKKSTTSTKKSTTASSKTGTTTKNGTTASSAQGNNSSDGQNNNSSVPVSYDENGQPVYNGDNGSNGGTPSENNVTDLGGRTVVIKTIKDIPVEATADEIALNPKAGIEYRFWKEAEKKLNFTASWEKVDLDAHVTDYINATTAGMKYADLMYTQTKRVYPTLPVNGLLVPLDDYIDFNDPLYNSGYLQELSRFNGKIYGFGTPYQTGYAVFYNKDITEREGIDIYNNYVTSGNWTWDTMVDVARATTKDTNGDGVIDQWGIMINNPAQSMDSILFSNGARYFDYRDGKYVFTANEPRAIKALQFMSDLRNVHKIAEFDKTNGLKWENGNGAIILGKLLSEGKNYKKLGINYGFAPLPKGPDVSEYQNVEGNGEYFWAIPLNTDAAASAAIIKEALTLWDTSRPEYMTKEEIILQKVQDSLNTSDEVDWVFNNYVTPQVSMHKLFKNANSAFTTEVTNKIFAQETTPAAALQTVEPLANAALASYMGY